MKSPHLARMTTAMHKLGENAYFGELKPPDFLLLNSLLTVVSFSGFMYEHDRSRCCSARTAHRLSCISHATTGLACVCLSCLLSCCRGHHSAAVRAADSAPAQPLSWRTHRRHNKEGSTPTAASATTVARWLRTRPLPSRQAGAQTAVITRGEVSQAAGAKAVATSV